MENPIVLERVNAKTIDTYIDIGKKSYQEHYLHLWENEDPTPYITKSFTSEVVKRELADPNMENLLIKMGNTPVGIAKLVNDCSLDEFTAEEALLVEKIYLLKEHTGKGHGKKVLLRIEDHAIGLKKKVIWLDTMQKGGPIHFYQKNGFKIKRESELDLAGAVPSEKAMWILTKQL